MDFEAGYEYQSYSACQIRIKRVYPVFEIPANRIFGRFFNRSVFSGQDNAGSKLNSNYYTTKKFGVIYNRLRYISTLQNTCKIKVCVGMEYIPSVENTLKIKF